MDLNRSTEKARKWIEGEWLPEGWTIEQDHVGRYVKIVNSAGGNHTVFHGKDWPTLVAFAEGVNAGRSHEIEELGK